MGQVIFWAGDSTVKKNDFRTYPQTGIGQGFELYIKQDILIKNHAENGRSTKSFLDEGRLLPIAEQIKKDDFLFIQFGHNDSKDDPLRHTEPYKDYQENLSVFIRTARDKEAHPLLITPLYRRSLDKNGYIINDSHGEYPAAMIELGRRLGVPVIDLCSLSKSLLEQTNNKISESWFMNLSAGAYSNYPDGLVDNTHLQYKGAVGFAGIIAVELRKLGNPYASVLFPIDTEE